MNKIEIMKKMLDVNQENGEVWYLLGLEYKATGNQEEAWKAFSEAIKYSEFSQQQKILEELASTEVVEKEADETKEDEKEVVGIQATEIESKPSDLVENNEVKRMVPLQAIPGGKNNPIIVFDDYSKKEVTFEDVGGLKQLKDVINMKIVKPFLSPDLFSKFKKKTGGGILLYGPPGCGKTFIAKATAGECNAHFMSVQISDILDPYLGVSSRNLRDIFIKARMNKPCVLFFDEIDTIGFNRAKLSSETMRPVIDQLLTEIEGIDTSTDKLLIIAATNMPWDVDPALKRPGRFDKSIFVLPPDEDARAIIFQLKLRNRPIEKIDYKFLAQRTEFYSGADIENVVEVASENVITEIFETGVERQITMNDLLAAIESTVPTTLEWLRTVKNYVKYANQSKYYNDVETYLDKYKKYI